MSFSNKRFPRYSSGSLPIRTRTVFNPSFVAHAVVSLVKFDCTPPVVIIVSAFFDNASARRYSNFLILFPPYPIPVMSSLFMYNSGTPIAFDKFSNFSKGVGSLPILILGISSIFIIQFKSYQIYMLSSVILQTGFFIR